MHYKRPTAGTVPHHKIGPEPLDHDWARAPTHARCPDCQGTGRRREDGVGKCRSCRGSGIVPRPPKPPQESQKADDAAKVPPEKRAEVLDPVLDAKQREADRLAVALDDRNRFLSDLEGRRTLLLASIQGKESTISTMADEVEQLVKRLRSLKADASGLEVARDQLEDAIDTLKERNKKTERKITTLRTANARKAMQEEDLDVDLLDAVEKGTHSVNHQAGILRSKYEERVNNAIERRDDAERNLEHVMKLTSERNPEVQEASDLRTRAASVFRNTFKTEHKDPGPNQMPTIFTDAEWALIGELWIGIQERLTAARRAGVQVIEPMQMRFTNRANVRDVQRDPIPEWRLAALREGRLGDASIELNGMSRNSPLTVNPRAHAAVFDLSSGETVEPWDIWTSKLMRRDLAEKTYAFIGHHGRRVRNRPTGWIPLWRRERT